MGVSSSTPSASPPQAVAQDTIQACQYSKCPQWAPVALQVAAMIELKKAPTQTSDITWRGCSKAREKRSLRCRTQAAVSGESVPPMANSRHIGMLALAPY